MTSPPPVPASVPLPLLLLAGGDALVACVLVVLGVPPVAAGAAVAVLALVHVRSAARLVLRAHAVRRPASDEEGALDEVRDTLRAIAAAAGVPAPEVRIGEVCDRGASAVARSRRAATVVVSPRLLRTGPAARRTALTRAIADIATGDAVVVTVASAPGAVGLTALTRILLRPGSRRREDVAVALAERLNDAVGAGSPQLPAVPYREFLRV